MKFNRICKIMLAIAIACCVTFSVVACEPITESQVDGVELSRATLSLDVGAQATLEATLMPLGIEANVAWKSSNAGVATVADGVVKAVAEGTAIIKATAGQKSATCTVTVTDPSKATVNVRSIKLTPSPMTLDVGEAKTFTVRIDPANATNKTLTWSSSKTDVAIVDNNGKVTGVKDGSSVITAKSHNNVTQTCIVTVGNGGEEEMALNVKKIESLADRTDFIMGMDASAVPSLESAGVTYKNFAGQTEDVYKILKDNGITDIRIRVWNDPYQEGHSGDKAYSYGGGNCDLANAVAISNRCKEVGLGVIIDFHYSDFWADPGKQTVPKAWKDLSVDERATKIYEFTRDSLNEIKATGVKITMVQVGNETTRAICGATFDKQKDVYCNYIAQGSRAVREVTGAVANGGAKVAIHLTNPESRDYVGYAKALHDANVDYDVFGSSYYPYWHGTLANLGQKLSAVNKAYGKEVMVLETSYAFTFEDADGAGNTQLSVTTEPVTVQGQANAILKVIETVANLGDYGLGVCYWEGTWIAPSTSKDKETNVALCAEHGCGWASARAVDYDGDASIEGGVVIDNQAFFMSDGSPLQSLKVFALASTGQKADPHADYLYAQEGYYTVNVDSVQLPKTVKIVMNDSSVLTVNAMWNVSDEDVAEYIKAVGDYVVTGTTMYGGTCTYTAYVQYPNLLVDGGFEDSKGYPATDNKIDVTAPWQYQLIASKRVLQLYASTQSDNAKMGLQSMHFWDDVAVEFKLYQVIDLASAIEKHGYGNYSFSMDIMGGDAGSEQDVHSYAVVTYKDGTQELVIDGSKVALTEWQEWHRTSVNEIEITENVASVTVGIYVKGEAGVWGNMDNAQFYYNPKTAE